MTALDQARLLWISIDGESQEILGTVSESRQFGLPFVQVSVGGADTFYAARLVRKFRPLSNDEIALVADAETKAQEQDRVDGPIDETQMSAWEGLAQQKDQSVTFMPIHVPPVPSEANVYASDSCAPADSMSFVPCTPKA